MEVHHINLIKNFKTRMLVTIYIFILFLTRMFAKRKTKFSGKIKWLSLIDIILVQNTLDPLYIVSWVAWCFFWDIYDRQYFGTAGVITFIVTCLRIVFFLKEMNYVYLACVLSSCFLCYASFYKFLELG